MKIDSYDKLPIGKYLAILALDKELPDLEYKTEVVAILNGTTVEAVLDQPLTVTRDQMQAADFLLQPMPRHDGKKVASSYKLGGLTLIPCTNVRNWNTAQYIDYQTYAKNTNPKVIPELLSCVLVPKGYAYNSGYDITAVHQAIRDYLPVAEAHRISAFFFAEISALHADYPNLFPSGSKEDSEEGEDGKADGVDSADAAAGGFSDRWGWIHNVDVVSETTRQPWKEIWEMNIVEFLNILCYRRDKREWEKAELEKWKRTH